MVPSSSQDEALARYSVSREVPRSVLKWETVLGTLMRPQKFSDIPVSFERNTEVPATTSSEPHIPSRSRQEGRFPCFVCNGFSTFQAQCRMTQVSRGIRDVASWVLRHDVRPRFSGMLLIRPRYPDTSSSMAATDVVSLATARGGAGLRGEYAP